MNRSPLDDIPGHPAAVGAIVTMSAIVSLAAIIAIATAVFSTPAQDGAPPAPVDQATQEGQQ